MFAREMDALRVLAVSEGPRVPIPYLYGHEFLLLEDLNPAPPSGDFWESFGAAVSCAAQ